MKRYLSRLPFRWLALDALLLAGAVLVGQVWHETFGAWWRFVIQTVAVGAPFVAAALALGAYPSRSEIAAGWRLLLAAGAAWLVAMPIGLWLRALALNQPAVLVSFMNVFFLIGLLVVLSWRLVWVLWHRRRASLPEVALSPASGERC